MRLKYEFVIRKICGLTTAVPVGKEAAKFNAILNLNDTAAFILERLNSDTTEEAIADALVEDYEVDKETALKDIQGMVQMLREKNLIVD